MNTMLEFFLVCYGCLQAVILIIIVIARFEILLSLHKHEYYFNNENPFKELTIVELFTSEKFNKFGKIAYFLLLLILLPGFVAAELITMIEIGFYKLTVCKPKEKSSGVPKHKEITIEPAKQKGEFNIIHRHINTLFESSQKRRKEIEECKAEIENLKQEIENLKDLICINK